MAGDGDEDLGGVVQRQGLRCFIDNHDKLRQMPFYTSNLLEKYAAMASEDWQEFLGSPGPKTEVAFVEFIRGKSNLTRAEAIRRLRAMIVHHVLEHPENAMRDYIAQENRARKNPLTMSRMNKTFFLESSPIHRSMTSSKRSPTTATTRRRTSSAC